MDTEEIIHLGMHEVLNPNNSCEKAMYAHACPYPRVGKQMGLGSSVSLKLSEAVISKLRETMIEGTMQRMKGAAIEFLYCTA